MTVSVFIGTFNLPTTNYGQRAVERSLHFQCTTEAELPTANLQDGDTASTEDTVKRWKRVGGAWVVDTAIDVIAVALQASGQGLTLGSWPDGQYLKRVGTTAVGATLGSSGTVSSVGLAAPPEFSISGSPVTASGVLGFQFVSPTLVAHGGTGMGSFAANSIIRAGLGSSSPFQSTPLTNLTSDFLRGDGLFGTPAYPSVPPIKGLIATNLQSTTTSSLTKSRISHLALASNLLSGDGSVLRIIAFGKSAATNNPKSFSLEVGGIKVAEILAGANNKAYGLEALITRQSGAMGAFYGHGVCGSQMMTMGSSFILSFSSSISIGAFSTTAVASGGFTIIGMTVEKL